MATFTITATQNIGALATKAGGDTYNIDGGTLVVDQDTRYGENTTTTTGGLGPITISATLGGTLDIDARNVRLIRYESGTGNVPAAGTTITDGTSGGSGKLIGVSSTVTAAPTAAGAAMPANGLIKIREWNGQEFGASNALTGIGASCQTAAYTIHGPGWISLVGDEAGLCTLSRKGLLRVRGAWYQPVGSTSGKQTDGNRATTYQFPTWGEAVYLPGVQVETSAGSGVYEWYPNAGSQTALVANVGTEAVRGKVCWISSSGVLRFGHDGTNSTGGYLPATGLNIRIPNIYMHSATTAARGTNQIPHATLATRYEFAAAGAAIEMSVASSAWYFNLNQSYSISLTDVVINDAIVVTELATPLTWTRVCVGHTQAQTQTALTTNLCFSGGTFNDCTLSRYSLASSGNYVASFTDSDGFTFNDCQFRMLAATRGNATSGTIAMTRANNFEFPDGNKMVGGRAYLTQCSNVTFTNPTYIDVPAGTTPTGNPMAAVDTGGGGCSNIKLDGINFGSLAMVQPYTSLMNVGVGGTYHRVRSVGVPGAELDLGGNIQYGVSWSRSTTTATVTKTAHGLKVNDIVYVYISSDTAAITLAAKTVASVPTADTFTFTCLNAGATNGTLTYFPQVTGTVISFAANSAAKYVWAQQVFARHVRTGAFSADNSAKYITYEHVWGDDYQAPVTAELSSSIKGLMATHAMTAQTNPVYGTHWVDCFIAQDPPNVSAQSWSRSTTTATLTSNSHGLRTGARVLVTVTSDSAAIVLGPKTITVTGANTFTFACLNAGSASGTLTYQPMNGRIIVLMNESNADSTSQVSLDAGGAGFTAAGTIYMPTVNDQATWTMPYYVTGHTSFPIDEAVMTGGTITNYDITYQIDKNDGSGFSAWKNLSYPRAGGGGSNASTNVTMTSTTGVAVGDYVFGTNIAPLAKVSSITNGTTIVVDRANVGTVSGILRFNQLPNDTIADAYDGLKLKVRIKTTTTNTSAVSSLYVNTYSPQAGRSGSYPLDTVSISITGLQNPSEVRVFNAGTGTELAGQENVTSGMFSANVDPNAYPNVDIVILALGHQNIRYASLPTVDGINLLVQQQIDRQYINP